MSPVGVAPDAIAGGHQHQEDNSPTASEGTASQLQWRLSLIAVFSVSLAICFWFNFSFTHVENSCVGDAGGYIEEARTCMRLATAAEQIFKAQLAGQFNVEQLNILAQSTTSGVPNLSLNGPVFPTLIACLYAAFGMDIGGSGWHTTTWYLPVMAQCVLVALNAVLLTVIGRRLWNQSVGLLAGCLAAVYPGYIINSNRITTEILACTFILSALLLVHQLRTGKRPVLDGVLLGICLTLTQFTRSVMVLLFVTLVPTGLVKLSRTAVIKASISIVIAAAFCFLPWLAWQQGRFGEAKLLLDRAGKFNLYVGNDVERQGWLSMPPLMPSDIPSLSNIQVLQRCINGGPWKFVKLQFDKPPRMVKTVWNDFRTPIGCFDYWTQILFHQALLMMGLVGVSLAVLTKDKTKLIPRLVVLEILAMHAIYFVFAPVPRYNLTAMPEVIVLAAAGIMAVVHLANGHYSPRDPKTDPARIAMSVIGTAVLLLTTCRFDRAYWLMQAAAHVDANIMAVVVTFAKLIALLLFGLALRTAARYVSSFKHANLIPVALLVLLAPFIAFPLRTYGRMEDRTVSLARNVGERNITIPQEELRIIRFGQPFIAVDASSLGVVNNEFLIQINGKTLDATAIPGAALLDAAKFGEISHFWNYRDAIFGVFSASAGISNLDLRQWFFIPVPPEILLEKKGHLHITLSARNPHTNATFNALQRSSKGFWATPSFTVYSFDKAFYGSEDDNGVTDARFDGRTPVLPSERNRTRIPSVFLFASPPLSNYVSEQHLKLLKHQTFSPLRLCATANGASVFKMNELPPCTEAQMWLVRLRGKIRSARPASPGIDLRVHFKPDAKDGPAYYDSKYAPSLLHSKKEWSSFDVLVPFGRRSFENRQFQDFTVTVKAVSEENWLQNNIELRDQFVEFSDMSMDLLQLPGHPLSDGYRVY